MSMIACTECAKEYSSTAAACPNCGARISKPKLWLWIPLGAVAAFFAFALLRIPSPEDHARSVDRTAVALCYERLKTLPLGTGEEKLASDACANMNRDFTGKYGVSP